MSGACPASRPRQTSSCSGEGPSIMTWTRVPTRFFCARATIRFCSAISLFRRFVFTAGGTSSGRS